MERFKYKFEQGWVPGPTTEIGNFDKCPHTNCAICTILSTIHQLKQSCGIFTNTLHADFMTLEQKLCQSREATQMNTKYSSIVINKNDTCAKDAEVRNRKNEISNGVEVARIITVKNR